jgi:hypothetical protein
MGEQYRSWSSSLCSFLHSPVTSSLLDRPHTYEPIASRRRADPHRRPWRAKPESYKVRLVTLHTRTSLTHWNPRPAELASQTGTCVGSFRPKYYSQHPYSTILSPCQRPSFTPVQNNRQNCIFVYLNLCILGLQNRRQNILHRMLASIPIISNIQQSLVLRD